MQRPIGLMLTNPNKQPNSARYHGRVADETFISAENTDMNGLINAGLMAWLAIFIVTAGNVDNRFSNLVI